jgi:hypothetical protein
MKMGINDLADGLLGHPLDLLVQRLCRRRLGVGIHHHHPIIGQNHRRIGIHLVPRRGDGGIDAIGHWFEFEEIFVGRLGVGWQDATEVEMLERLDGRSGGPNTSEKLSTRPVCAHELPSSTALEAVYAAPDRYLR